MRLLQVLNPEGVNVKKIERWHTRRAARAVVFDNKKRIGLLHVKKENYYKLPGGGIEPGENIKKALDRECEEELGIAVAIKREVGSIVEYHKREKLRQTSYCFLAGANAKKKLPHFTEEEESLGFTIVWVRPRQALKLLNLKKTRSYVGKFIEKRDFCFLNTALSLCQGK